MASLRGTFALITKFSLVLLTLLGVVARSETLFGDVVYSGTLPLDQTYFSVQYRSPGAGWGSGPVRCTLLESWRHHLPAEGLNNHETVKLDACAENFVVPDEDFVLLVTLDSQTRECFRNLRKALATFTSAASCKLLITSGFHSHLHVGSISGAAHIPTCDVYREDSGKLEKVDATRGISVNLHNGDVAHFSIGMHSSGSHQAFVDVFADGEKLKSESNLMGSPHWLALETYKILSFQTNPNMEWIYLAATDGFMLDTMWRCASVSEIQDLGNSWMFANATVDIENDRRWTHPSATDNDDSAVVGVTLTNGLHLNVTRMSVKGFAGGAVCRGVRSDAPEIMHRAKAYKVDYEPKRWPEARSACEKAGMQLASVHSARDNMFLQSLVGSRLNFKAGDPNGSAPKAWLGYLDDRWIDHSSSDFWAYNFVDDELDSYSTADNFKYLFMDSGLDPDASWLYAEGTELALPYVCQRFVEDGGAFYDDGKRCMFYLTGDDETEGQMNTPPKPRRAASGLCSLGDSVLSCCTDHFVDTVVSQRVESAKRKHMYDHVKNQTEIDTCLEVLEPLLCFDCRADQGDFLSYASGTRTLRVCRDTADLLHAKCGKFLAGRRNFTSSVWGYFQNLLSMEHIAGGPVIVEEDSTENCLRVPAREKLSLVRTLPEKEVTGDQAELRLIFSRSIRHLTFVSLNVYPPHHPDQGFFELPITLTFDTLESPSAFRFESESAVNDTIVLNLTQHVAMASDCMFDQGQYSLYFSRGYIHDLAGDPLKSRSIGVFTSKNRCHSPDYSLVWALVACVFLTCAIFAGVCVRHAWRQRQISRAEGLEPLQNFDDFQRMDDRVDENLDDNNDDNLNASDARNDAASSRQSFRAARTMERDSESPLLRLSGANQSLEMQDLSHA
ncbi:Hypothetical Protein FCC1311_022522 [Hondaea fermentalgiana]|uniref:C-type lectin domain-containing protein n=1 Tax=Hondaea fermentalgiana TaxID=2315210 RepID=A0A2R5G4S5_9STRA|nr:Hypothetical Protein FCC1311_022522 [Hondaea fermentalgiana]|eukprot:GBG26032.1 Hypothetical Protein FCC1311_022522 [Hondaea fermentalgiana]